MKKSEQSGIKYKKYLWLAFGCSAAIMALVYLMSRILPFGEITILRMDLYHQYGPLFAELYERIRNADSFLYSWCSGLGSCFLGNYFNYLSSPVAAVVMLFGHANVPEAIAAMILIKAALSSMSFTHYIGQSLGKINYTTVSFGVIYSFCGYFVAYYWNVMWIDAMVLLPLVALGIERIINNGKIRTYTVALALTMFSNYYMSFMMCVFSVLYFFLYFYSKYENGDVLSAEAAKRGLIAKIKNSRFFRSGIKFACGSLAAAGLIAFALIPTYLILQSSSATSGKMPDEWNLYFNFFDFLTNHLSAIEPTIRSSGDDVLPNVFCSVLTVLLIPLFVMTKSISKKEKAASIAGLAFFYIGFASNVLNYIWHGLHLPNDLPYRQSFMYTFLLLVIAYKTFIRLNELSSRQIAAAGTGLILFIIIADKVGSKNFSTATFYISVIFAFFYTLLLIFFKDRRYASGALSILMLVTVSSEILVADTGSYSINQSKDAYVSDLSDFEDLKKYLDTLENGDFYRMELSYLRTRMDPCWYYYNGVSTFSSMAYEATSKLMHKMGMYSNDINSYTYYPQTPVFNSMLSLQYIVNNVEPNVLEKNKDYYKYLSKLGKYTAYKNEYCLPIGFCVDKQAQSWNHTSADPFEVQGSLFALSSGEKNPFEDVKISYATYSNMNTITQPLDSHYFTLTKTNTGAEASVTFFITPEKDGNVYLYFDAGSYYNSSQGEGTITVESSSGTQSFNLNIDTVIDTGYQGKGDLMTVKLYLNSESKDSTSVNVYAVTLNDSVFKKGFKTLQDGQLEISEFTDTKITGNFSAKQDGLFFTSIPYDTSWEIYVDGKKLDYAEYKTEDNVRTLVDENIGNKVFALGNGLISFGVEKGEHQLEMKYSPAGLSAGIKLSLLTAIVILLYFILKRFNIIHRLPVIRSCPEYPEIKQNITNDIFICGNEPYIDPPAENKANKKIEVDYPVREIIVPPVIAVKATENIVLNPEDTITLEQAVNENESSEKADGENNNI
ncbi:MAG: YfhO family protein [Clostridia bacterium]|nr:YfhO family protein [Clostridia bacterium]